MFLEKIKKLNPLKSIKTILKSCTLCSNWQLYNKRDSIIIYDISNISKFPININILTNP
jgi:hypothetical protein